MAEHRVSASGRAPPESWWPAGDASLQVSRLTIRAGLSLRLITAGPATGAPIVLIHGWGVHAYLWRHTIPALVAAGRRVVAFDLPGHGLSDRPLTPGSYTLGALTRDVTAVFDALGIARAPVVAQSMGGRIAMELARLDPARVSALVLFGGVGLGVAPRATAFAHFLPVPRTALASLLVRRWMVALSRSFAYGRRSVASPRDVDAYWAVTQYPEFLAAMRQALIEFDWRELTRDEAARLATPTLAVFGTRDRTVRPVHAAALVAAMPHGSLYWVRDAGHVANEEAYAEVNPILVEFLARSAPDAPEA